MPRDASGHPIRENTDFVCIFWGGEICRSTMLQGISFAGASRRVLAHPGIDFPFEKPYLLTRASPQDDARSEANSLKLGKYSIAYSIIVSHYKHKTESLETALGPGLKPA